MKRNHPLHEVRQVSRPYRVTDGAKFRLRDYPAVDTGRLHT